MKSVFITRAVPGRAREILEEAGVAVFVSGKDAVLTHSELIGELAKRPYDGVLCLLTDAIDAAVFDAVPTAKIFANYAVGFDNIDLSAAKARGVTVTNTPDVLTETVAEHTVALALALVRRVAEGDRFVRAGRYDGWAPSLLLGTDLTGKAAGLLGAGRIGGRVAHRLARGFGMRILYYDLKRSDALERDYGAEFRPTPEEVLAEADLVSVHVPLTPATKHLIDARRLSLMKKTAYLVNTSRGPVVDETALVAALRAGEIRGAALDVFEEEPKTAPGLAELENVVLTPHIASATEETRAKMGEVAASNILDFFAGKKPRNAVA